jgi:homoserine kinase
MKLKIFAPATIGNVGPGFDVLGLAVEGIGDTFEIEPVTEPEPLTIEGRDADVIPVDPQVNTVTLAASYLFAQYQKIQPLRVKISRQLPASGGLGASAASSVAGALAAATLLEIDNIDKILEAALYAEGCVSGRHLDNIAPCLLGGLTVVHQVDPPQVIRAPCSANFTLVLVTPGMKLSTKNSRALLPGSLSNAAWVQQMAHTAGLLVGLGQGDIKMIRQSLKDPFAEPQRAPLIPGFYKAQKAARDAQALGFTISGGGPSCFAICETEEIAHQVGDVTAPIFGEGTTVHIGPVAQQGARLL